MLLNSVRVLPDSKPITSHRRATPDRCLMGGWGGCDIPCPDRYKRLITLRKWNIVCLPQIIDPMLYLPMKNSVTVCYLKEITLLTRTSRITIACLYIFIMYWSHLTMARYFILIFEKKTIYIVNTFICTTRHSVSEQIQMDTCDTQHRITAQLFHSAGELVVQYTYHKWYRPL